MNSLYITKQDLEGIKDRQWTAFHEWQINELRKRTPSSETQEKQDENGNKYKTVSGSFMKKRLNLIFGWDWDFQIVSKEYFSGANEVIVHGRLTIRSKSLHPIIREQFGKHYLEVKTTSNRNVSRSSVVNIGNGYKSAATDAFKKCASEIGLCWDIYSSESPEGKPGEEKPEMSYDEQKVFERLDTHLSTLNSPEKIEEAFEQFEEDHGKENITEALELLSVKHINRVLKKG
jgi:hypothetical protein